MKAPDANAIRRKHGAGVLREAIDEQHSKAKLNGKAAPPKPILALADWLVRDLPAPDCICGNWLSTTSRVLMVAPTGLGKTMFGIGLGMAVAAGRDFLHWRGVRPARVLYIDGEQSRRLLKQRLVDESGRLGACPNTFFAFNREDFPNFEPLNTPAGQAFIEGLIEQIGGVDLIQFDNVMSLIAGDQRDEEGWTKTMPWIQKLTRRSIGQIWTHHTGHDTSRSYGTKTREWGMDTVMHAEEVKRADTDISFQLNFSKARERTPATRAEFQEVRISLVNDRWLYEGGRDAAKPPPSPTGRKFRDALHDATIGNEVMHGCPAATLIEWRASCVKLGLIEPVGKPDGARSLFARHKLELITKNWIACDEIRAWILP
jgi:AAA domain